MSKHLSQSVRVPIEPDDPSIIRDESLCIKCGMCKNICEERQSVAGFFSLDKTGDKGICIECGQCVNYCPVGSLQERNDVAKVEAALNDPAKVVFVQTSPSTRVGIGEACGLPVGTFSEGKLVSALKKLGFKYVFDTNFAADLTIMEEATELTARLADPDAELPMFTSCCPAWVKFAELFFPQYLGHISSSRSPLLMSGPTLKVHYAKKYGKTPASIFNVGVTPCTAKKFEITRPEMNAAGRKLSIPGMRDFDAIITVRELAGWLKAKNIDFASLPDTPYDSLTGSGAGAIFSNTGGVTEAALRTAHFLLTGKNPPADFLQLKPVRGMKGIKEAEVTIAGKKIRACVVHTTANVRKLLNDFENTKKKYDFIEVMTCLGGCIGGGGQPKCDNSQREAVVQKRIDCVYDHDAAMTLRFSHENPEIQELYKEFYGKPLSELAEELLHTVYASRAGELNAASDTAETKGNRTMKIKAVKFNEKGFMTQPFALGGEDGPEKFDAKVRYRSCLQNYLIDTGDEVILVDTGLPAEFPDMVVDENTQIYLGNRIVDYMTAFKALGYRPEQVTKILVTHKHEDHTGELRSFPNAKIYLSPEEADALKLDGPNIVRVQYKDGPYHTFDASEKIAEGVYLLPAKGHTRGNSIIVAECDGLFYMMHGDVTYTDEALYENKLSVVFEDQAAARDTLNRVRAFIRKNPTVYCSTHTPLGYEHLEAKRVMDLDNPVENPPPGEIAVKQATGKYVCSVCGTVYDPAVGDPAHGIPAGTKFEDLPEDWKCPRCRQPKGKFNKA